MRLAICITFFYKYSRLEYLRKICKSHQDLGVEYTTFIITNAKEKSEIELIKENVFNKDLHIITPSYLGHPFLLTWSHRDVFREQISNYSHFLYTEDDILFTKKNLDYWIESREILRKTPYIPSFFRYEVNSEGEYVSTDVTKPQSLQSHIFYSKDKIFINLMEPYQGMYLMDKKLLIELLFTNASSPDTGIWQIREKASQGLTFWNVPEGAYSRMLVGLDHHHRISHNAMVHHLPNNYANDSEIPLGSLPVKDILYY